MASLGTQLKASVPMLKAIRGELTFALVGFALDTSKKDIFFHDLTAKITMLA